MEYFISSCVNSFGVRSLVAHGRTPLFVLKLKYQFLAELTDVFRTGLLPFLARRLTPSIELYGKVTA